MESRTGHWWSTLLPEGRGLQPDVWQRRHWILSMVLIGHVPVLYLFGVLRGFHPFHVAWEVGILLAIALAAQWAALPRTLREVAIGAGLLSSSALLVHLSGGFIEAHFHFFVMLPLVAMYQRWVPFLVAVGFVLVHHGLVGVLDPESVYNHPAAIAHPWTWAGIHAFFVALECLTLFRLWREVEDQQAAADAANVHAAELLQVQAVKERLLRVASHELSTPLTPIKLQLRMMEDPRLAKDTVRRDEALAVLRRNFNRLERIVATVLDAVRLDNDAIRLRREPHDVAALARQSAGAYQELADTRSITLDVETQEAVAEVDDDRIGQVLDNLLSNALKYTPEGGRVELRVTSDGKDVLISLADNGRGLSQKQVHALFQPFAMVHEDASSSDGTGLGLYICKGIVEGHGGTLQVHSEGPTLGTTFTARFPCKAAV